MLKALRKRLKVILWILLTAFILWGIGTALATRQSPAIHVGTLYGRPVTVPEFQAAVESRRHRAVLTYGERALALVPAPELERQAWDWLLLTKAARRARIRVSDREVIEELRRWPLFQRDGSFEPRTYQFVVRYSLGTTPRAFEEEVRDQLAVAKLLDRIAGAVEITDEELRAAYREETKGAEPLDDEEVFAQAKERLRTPLVQRKRSQRLEEWLRQLRAEAKPTPITRDKPPVTGDK